MNKLQFIINFKINLLQIVEVSITNVSSDEFVVLAKLLNIRDS